MKKRTYLWRNLIILVVFVILLALWRWFGWTCLPRRLTGIPCPGCGLTRAWLAVLRMDFSAAFRYHPMFWSIPIFMVFLLFGGDLFPNPRWNRWVLGSLVIGFLGCYLIRLIGFLGGYWTI